MIGDQDRETLRAYLPEVLAARCGIEDLTRSFRCPSPAHDDRTPSARYYRSDCSVHCFGCGKTWDVFSLVGELDGIEGFPEQARAVARMVGPTVVKWLRASTRFDTTRDPSTGHALVVRKAAPVATNDAATSALAGGDADKEEGAQGVLPMGVKA